MIETSQKIGKKVLANDLVEVFTASEGSINMYYGLIGNGKTYSATADILDLLKQGKVVYANWHIKVDDFDDRDSFIISLMNFVLGRERYYRIPCAKNLHFFDPESFASTPELVDWLSKLNDCHIFFDEGQDMFDSYEGTRFSKSKRRLILHTRHYHRTLNIISQRPTAIQVSARGNVNRFYKCVKSDFLFWTFFTRLEFQEMAGETVDETKEPITQKTYLPSPAVFNAYNTDYLAQGIPKSQVVNFEAFDLSFKERYYVFVSNFLKVFEPLRFKNLFKKFELVKSPGVIISKRATLKNTLILDNEASTSTPDVKSAVERAQYEGVSVEKGNFEQEPLPF